VLCQETWLHVIDIMSKQINNELLNEMIEREKRFNSYLIQYNFRKWLLLIAYNMTHKDNGNE